MWGGWYDDDEFMQTFAKMQKTCGNGMDRKSADVAVFTDENCYFPLRGHRNRIWNVCNEIGLSGVMYDIFLASDFEKVCDDYKTCVFVEPDKTQLLSDCIKTAKQKQKNIMIITDDDEVDCETFKGFFESSGITVPTKEKAVVYSSENHVTFYAHEKGKYDFTFDGRKTFTDLFTGKEISFPTEIKKTTCWLFRK